MEGQNPKNSCDSDDDDDLNLELSLGPPTLQQIRRLPPQLYPYPPQQVENKALHQQPEPLPPPPPDPHSSSQQQQQQQQPISHPSTPSRDLSVIDNRNSRSSKPKRRRGTSIPTQESPSTHSSSEQQPIPRRQRTTPSNTTIEPPYPWSTANRAVIHNLNYLQQNQILTITGDVKCNRCEKQYKINYDLITKFNEIKNFVEKNKDTMHERAPGSWTNPNLPNCKVCRQERCARPVIPPEDEDDDHKNINWLFLLLGQMIGCLGLKHLKYFCTYTNNHRTAAKDRLVYLTYLTLCRQLQPSDELFNR